MNDKQIKFFISAADARSFSKAASKCFISTPALINQINQLEKELNVELFDRSARGLELTEAGQFFYHEAERISRLLNEVNKNMQRFTVGKKRVIRFMAGKNDVTYKLYSFYKQYQDLHPDISIVLIENNDMNIWESLLNNEAEIVLDTDAGQCSRPFGTKFLPVYYDVYGAMMDRDHPLAKVDTITYLDLEPYTILLRDLGPLKNESRIQNFYEHGIKCELYDPKISVFDALEEMTKGRIIIRESRWCIPSNDIITVKKTDINSMQMGLRCRTAAEPYVWDFIEAAKRAFKTDIE